MATLGGNNPAELLKACRMVYHLGLCISGNAKFASRAMRVRDVIVDIAGLALLVLITIAMLAI
jgi:hypothetical protein